MDILDKCRGSLVGGACGDALGYTVEFLSYDKITETYGKAGITRYDIGAMGAAMFSDDTQMTLFTADGLMNAFINSFAAEKDLKFFLSRAYKTWYLTQTAAPQPMKTSWLTHIYSLWSQRAPGNTCLTALRNLEEGNTSTRNDSKGCGGIMRVAPIGIFAAAHPATWDDRQTARIAGIAAEITHHHPLSTYASAAFAVIVKNCIENNCHTAVDIEKTALHAVDTVTDVYGKDAPFMAEFSTLISKAVATAKSTLPDQEAISSLGEGWVAEETLAIALLSCLRHIDDFSACITCAVNHSGDSDSTGAVAGNIAGAVTGYDNIPSHFLTQLELCPIIVSMADDLCADTETEQIKTRYIDHLPGDINDGFLI